jgi:hypothetical protein
VALASNHYPHQESASRKGTKMIILLFSILHVSRNDVEDVKFDELRIAMWTARLSDFLPFHLTTS